MKNFKAVLTAALLLLLSLSAAQAKSMQTRERAIAEVTRLGGKIEFDESRSDKPILKIDLHGTRVTDADLVFLKNLRELQALDLRITQVGDAGVANCKSFCPNCVSAKAHSSSVACCPKDP